MKMTEEKPKQEPVQAQKPAGKQAAKKDTAENRIAAVLIRNTTQASGVVRDTLQMLRLQKKHTCVILDANPVNKGMLTKVKDYITYGEIDAETLKLLTEKTVKTGRKDLHLHPPKGGFERKGIKHSFTQGGALGYRGANMNQLIRKML